MTSSTYPILPIEIRKTTILPLVRTILNNLHRSGKLTLFYGATGVGKTTTLPFHISNLTQGITVLVDSIALKNSLSKYMQAAPSVKYKTKLEFALNPTLGYVLVDESHQNDHLTQHIVNRLATPDRFFLTSATALDLSADPSCTLHDIKEIFDPRYTLESLYNLTHLPYLEPSSSGHRTCVFVPNDADAVTLAQRYTGIPVFAITTSNITTQIPLISTTTGPLLIFSSPVMQTGITLDLDIVIDLGLSNSVEFKKGSHINHINTVRINSTYLERTQRRGRVGRLKRGLYINCNSSYSTESPIHPYFRELYDRLGKPITTKLRNQLSSNYHPFVTDLLFDNQYVPTSYSNLLPSGNSNELPKKFSYNLQNGVRYHSPWWDHTVSPNQIHNDLCSTTTT